MKTIEKQKTEKATRPASRWRNRWFALCDYRTPGGMAWKGGQEHWGTLQWPSRDIAETMGKQWECEYPSLAKYLGAFPVDA